MGRLVLRDVRRHPAEAAMFLLAVIAATTTLTLGLAVGGATDTLYAKTRAATAGPDVTATITDPGAAALAARLEHAPGVTTHAGPYLAYDTTIQAHGHTVWSAIEARDAAPAALDRPLVTSGSWLRPGGAVIERGFAHALGLRVGDRITAHGHTFPVIGIAITAATSVYPWQDPAQGSGPSHFGGLLWLTPPDARAATDAQSFSVYLLDLKLSDPAATGQFIASVSTPTMLGESWAHFGSWQDTADQDAETLRFTQPALVIGGWLLAIAAIVGLAALVAARAAHHTRRVGVLKAVGATPSLVAAVLLTEYLLLTSLATALALLVGSLAAPELTDPSAGLLDTTGPPSPGTIASAAFLAGTVAACTTLAPTLRAARTSTVAALSNAARAPQHRAALTAASAYLPTALLLAMRLIARRPGRAALTTLGTATTSLMIATLLAFHAAPDTGDDFGPSTLIDVRNNQVGAVLLGITLALASLSTVNTMVLGWSIALQARRTLTIARTLGTTPSQVITALCVAQLLPALPGLLLGLPAGLALYWAFSIQMTTSPATWLLAAALAILLATTAFTAVPAWIHTRRPAAHLLSAETT